MYERTELLDCTSAALDAATEIIDFQPLLMPKTEVLNQSTESLDDATERSNEITG